MSTTITGHGLEVVRESKGKRSFVVLYFEGQEVHRLGGNRAARAQAAIVLKDNDRHDADNGYYLLGLRSDVHAAIREAQRCAAMLVRYDRADGSLIIGDRLYSFASALEVKEA